MPELLTKYPSLALKILKEAGAKCDAGAKQKILTKCPNSQFCALPTGELCFYGINEMTAMTQISSADFADVISTVPTIYSTWNILLLAAACLLGMIFGMKLKK